MAFLVGYSRRLDYVRVDGRSHAQFAGPAEKGHGNERLVVMVVVVFHEGSRERWGAKA